MIEKKKETLDNLYYGAGKQQFDFFVAGTYIKDGETQCRTCSTGFFGQQTGRATCTCPKNECVCEIGLTLGIQTVNCTPNGTLLVDPTIDSCF